MVFAKRTSVVLFLVAIIMISLSCNLNDRLVNQEVQSSLNAIATKTDFVRQKTQVMELQMTEDVILSTKQASIALTAERNELEEKIKRQLAGNWEGTGFNINDLTYLSFWEDGRYIMETSNGADGRYRYGSGLYSIIDNSHIQLEDTRAVWTILELTSERLVVESSYAVEGTFIFNKVNNFSR